MRPKKKPAAKNPAKKKAGAKPKAKPPGAKPKEVTAMKATICKHDVIIRLVGTTPEKWEYRKDGKAIAEVNTFVDAKAAVVRDLKITKPNQVKWAPCEDTGPSTHGMTDADFRLEVGALSSKIANKGRELLRAKDDLDNAKGRVKGLEADRELLYAEMMELAGDQAKGQGRLNLRGDRAGKKPPATNTKKGAAKKPPKTKPVPPNPNSKESRTPRPKPPANTARKEGQQPKASSERNAA